MIVPPVATAETFAVFDKIKLLVLTLVIALAQLDVGVQLVPGVGGVPPLGLTEA